MDEGEGSGTTGSEVSMSLPNLLLGILWSPYAKIHLVIGLSAMIGGFTNGPCNSAPVNEKTQETLPPTPMPEIPIDQDSIKNSINP